MVALTVQVMLTNVENEVRVVREILLICQRKDRKNNASIAVYISLYFLMNKRIGELFLCTRNIV